MLEKDRKKETYQTEKKEEGREIRKRKIKAESQTER